MIPVSLSCTKGIKTMQSPIIAGIKKDIRRNAANHDYDCYVTVDSDQPRYIGSAARYSEAERKCNAYAYDMLTDSHTYETAAQLIMQMAA